MQTIGIHIKLLISSVIKSDYILKLNVHLEGDSRMLEQIMLLNMPLFANVFQERGWNIYPFINLSLRTNSN